MILEQVTLAFSVCLSRWRLADHPTPVGSAEIICVFFYN